ncbi:hypothetical protein OIU84_027551 [Salix udensis]|uniref:Uncharacterized protein n=1 Tax=Salix udensis TaxID=889485 RepID=A0AAD6KFL0_9ROSI|nr:hypothetical protein OIU84_027551 [Salix udensis]
MEKDVDGWKNCSLNKVKTLEELDKENFSNRQKPGCGKGTGVDRSRTSTTIAFEKEVERQDV